MFALEVGVYWVLWVCLFGNFSGFVWLGWRFSDACLYMSLV